MFNYIIYIIFIMSIILQNCSKDYNNDENLSNNYIKLPNDIRWVTNSSEYKILCEQIYYNAWSNISQIIELQPQIIGFRSAVCKDGDRNSEFCFKKLE